MERSVAPEAGAAQFVSGPRSAPDDGRQQAVVSAVASAVTCVLSSAVLVTLPSVFRLLESGDQPSTLSSPGSPVFADRPSDSSLGSSPSNLFVTADDGIFRSCGFENRSYFSVLPAVPQQERSEVRTHGELICDLVYRGADGVMSIGQHLLLTSASLPLMDTDMSYQVHEPDSVQYRGGPAGSISPLATDFTYQTFESLVEPPDVLLLDGEERSDGHPDDPPAATPEPLSHAQAGVSGRADNARRGAASPTFQAPFLSLFSADQSTPVIIESDYQSVEPSHVC